MKDRNWFRFGALYSLLLFGALVLEIVPGFSQNPPSPAPPQKDRSLTLDDPAKKENSAQKGPQGDAPELVLQTGYTALSVVQSVSFSPDGKLLATSVFSSNQVKLWDTTSGLELRTLSIEGGAGTFGPVNLTGVSNTTFSRDGRYLAVAGRDNSLTVWDVATGSEIRQIASSSQSIASSLGAQLLAFNTDSTHLIAIGDAFRIWDLTTGQKVLEKALSFPIISGFGFNNLAQNPYGNEAALFAMSDNSASGRVVAVYDLSTGNELQRTALPSGFQAEGAVNLQYVTGGHLLAAAVNAIDISSGGGQLKYVDLSTGAKPVVLASLAESTGLRPMVISPDGKWLAMGTGLTVRIWNLASGAELTALTVAKEAQFGQRDNVTALGFSSDGKTLGTAVLNSPVSLWDVAGGQQIGSLSSHTNYASGVSFSTDGLHMISGTKTVWDLGAGLGLRAGRDDSGYGTLSRDGRLMAISLMKDNTVDLLDLAKQQKLFTLAPSEHGTVSKLPVFSPDGSVIATMYRRSGNDSAAATPARTLDPAAARQAAQNMMKQMGKNPAAAMQQYQNMIAGQLAAKTGLAGRVKLWDTASGRELRTIDVPPASPFMHGEVTGASFSPDGKLIATTVSFGNAVTVWDVSTGAMVRTFGASTQTPGLLSPGSALMAAPLSIAGGGDVVSTVAFSADGKMLAAGGRSGSTDFDPAKIMAQSAANAKRGGKQPDYRAMATEAMTKSHVSTSGTIKLWDVATGRELKSLTGHTSGVRALALGPDAKVLASAAADNDIKLWDVASGQEKATLKGHTAQVNSLAFNVDGSILASASEDGATILWDASTGTQLATLISLFDGSEWLVVTPDGLFDGSPGSFNQILWRYNKNTFNVAPVEWFFKDFFYPGLLSELMAGKRPKAPRSIDQIDRRPPGIKLTLLDGPTTGAPLKERNQRIKVEITKAEAGARDVRLFRNGSLVKVWHGEATAGQSFEATVPIVAGLNHITAYAFNRDNVKSVDAVLDVTGDVALKRPGTLYVLSVGVNSYANDAYNLRYAVADAQDFGAEIERQQLKLGSWSTIKVIPLLDQDATKANILYALDRLAGHETPPTSSPVAAGLENLKQSQPEDAIFVFFAGHGTAQQQRFYLIPHDLGYQGPRNALDAAGLNTILLHSISDADLENAFENIDAGQLVLVIDACNSGQALEAEEKRRGPMNSKGLAQLAYEKGMYVLTAAQSFQAAQEVAQVGHGLLTFALVEEGLKLMKADDDPKDNTILAREWLNYATDRVPQMQVEKLSEAKSTGRSLSFGNDAGPSTAKYAQQRPRVFYRRERDQQPLVVARSQ